MIARRAVASTALLLLTASSLGCGRFARVPTDESAEPTATTRPLTTSSTTETEDDAVAGRTPVEAIVTSTAVPTTDGPGAASSSGAFEITVAGRDDGRPRSGIPATVTGPVSRRIVSDDQGLLVLRGPAGEYRIRIEPSCGSVLEVRTSAVGTATVVAGQVARGTLAVAWRQRYAPGGRVRFEIEDRPASTGERGRSWAVGTPYLARFDVMDRCDGKPAPGASFASYAFSSAPGVEVSTLATTADERGRGAVRLTCRQPVEDVSLVATDREAEHDRYDLFERAHLDDSPPKCI